MQNNQCKFIKIY